MPRIRTIKPELSKHEDLFDAEQETGLPIRYAWAVLPCFCDREGRFAWRARRLTAEVLPYDDDADMRRVLDALLTRGFIARYRVGDAWFGWIPTFDRHQVVNNRERASELPDPADADELEYSGNHELPFAVPTRSERVNDASGTRVQSREGEGKGREGKGTGKEGGGAPDDAPPAPGKTAKKKTANKTSASQGSRIPDNCPTDDDLIWSTENFPAIDHNAEAAKFRDYWISVPGQRGRKADWPATWRTWIRKAAEWQQQRSGGPGGPGGARSGDDARRQAIEESKRLRASRGGAQ